MNNKVYSLAKRFKKKFFGTIAFRLKAHSKVIEDHLNDDEKLLYVFCGQKGPSHCEIFTTCVFALTDKRMIIATKRVLWGYFYNTVSLELFNDLKIHSGIFFGKVIIDTAKEVIIISNLAKGSLYEIETSLTSLLLKAKKKLEKKADLK